MAQASILSPGPVRKSVDLRRRRKTISLRMRSVCFGVLAAVVLGLLIAMLIPGALFDLFAQQFIRRRGLYRWLTHQCIFWGVILSCAITFPLTFGWLRFTQTASGLYQIWVFSFPFFSLPADTFLGFLIFHALDITALILLVGLVLALATGANERSLGIDRAANPISDMLHADCILQGRIALVQGQVFIVAIIVIAQLWLVTDALYELLSGRVASLAWLALASVLGFALALIVVFWPRRRIEEP